MCLLLRWKFFTHAVELAFHAFDLLPRHGTLASVQLRGRGARQSPLCAVQNRRHHLQVSHQGGGGARGGSLFLSLGFEKQFRLIQNALADRRRSLPPGGIQLTSLAWIAVILGEDRRHPLAVLQADARHRHQKLHSHLRGDFALTHLLLNAFRKKFHQRQPPRYPTHAAVEPAG
jgi:hypothetical protein